MSRQTDPAKAEALRSLLRTDFRAFSQFAFRVINPSTPFLPNWHMDAIAYHLQLAYERKIKRLIINVPPRYGKSVIASCALPAWSLGKDPALKFMCISYAQDLADRFARDTNRIFNDPRFRTAFPALRWSDRKSVAEMETTLNGSRFASSIHGALLGRGADFIIIDDPMKPSGVMSEAERNTVNEAYDGAIITRLNNRNEGVVVLVHQRLVDALGIVHAQGLVHGHLSTDSLMTEGAEDPDFQLTGFEWSLWLTADKAERAHARLGESSEAVRANRYSFEEDWKALGGMTAQCLDAVVRASGDVQAAGNSEMPITLSLSERALLKRLAAPTRFDNLDAISIARAIDDIVAEVGRPGSARTGSFILMFSQNAGLGNAVYTVTDGAIPEDEYRDQLDWVRADLDRGVALLVPREFDPGQSRLQLVSDQMVYTLGPLRQEGTAAWDVAVCSQIRPRGDALRLGGHDEHELVQPIAVTTAVRTAIELRANLGPEALDWSGFATAGRGAVANDQVDLVRQPTRQCVRDAPRYCGRGDFTPARHDPSPDWV